MVKLTENKITVLDFVISILSQYEKEIDKQLDKLKKITERLEKSSGERPYGKTVQRPPNLPETRTTKRKINRKQPQNSNRHLNR